MTGGHRARFGSRTATALGVGLSLLVAGCAPAVSETGGDAPAAPAAAAAATGTRSVLAGVFTAEQATRGQQSFQRQCASCHAPSEFTGGVFQRIWANRPVGDLYNVIATQMPMTAPGSLPPQEYTDIVTYFLRQNGYPTGQSELAADRAELDRLIFEPIP
jgi:S-disulfanyl-L-cysteine oxidoreductase SoxD